MEKPTILAVDDEPNNIKLLNQILSTDFRIRVATNGQQALERASLDPIPDLVLLDIMMPGMDGYQVCRQLKAREKTAGIPVIFLTAKTQQEDIVEGFNVGAVDYLTKPFNRRELTARVNTHLELKRSREQILEQNRELTKNAAIREDIDRVIRHDLKSPLNAILGFPQFLMSRENMTDTDREYLQRILDSGTRMLQMIDLSLDLIKMEKGTYTLNPMPVDLVALIQEVITELSNVIKANEISVVFQVQGRTPTPENKLCFMGEELLCHTMVSNLLKNAVEASPKDEVILIDLDKAETIKLRFRNKGAVPEEVRRNFFDKYVTAGKVRGTGLGTYSAKMITNSLNGQIEMETSEEKGTCITVSFPLEQGKKPVATSQTSD